MTSHPPLIFLLGLQRSGSTWLTNILDSHPGTNVFMEPFAPSYGIFPEFPKTSYFLEESTDQLDRLLREDVPERLRHYKHLLTQRAEASPSWFKLERSITNSIVNGRAFLPERLWARARKTQLLNLNRMDPHAPLVEKATPPSAWVIKELRLAGKIPLLRRAFPEAKFIVLLRHPGASVQAITSWFKRGRLAELRRELDSFLSEFSAQKAAEPYEEQLELCRRGPPIRTLALYWRVCNETMVRKLEGTPHARVLTYEELASAPAQTTQALLDFVGLARSDSTTEYIRHSSTTPLAEGGRITTLRASASHYRLWQTKISPELADATALINAGSPLMKLFEPFYS